MARGLVRQEVDADVVSSGILQQIDNVAVVGDGNGLFPLHGLIGQGKCFGEGGSDMPYPTLSVARLNARSVHLGYDGCCSGHFGGLGLCATHTAQSRRDEEAACQIAVLRDAQFQASGIEQGVERAVYDALRTDVHPAAGRHLTVVGHAHLHGGMPVLLVVVQAYHQGVGNNDAGRFGLRLEQPQRMSTLDDERLILRQHLQILLDEPVLHPVLTHLARLTVGNQFVRIEGDVETKVVVDHHLKGFPFDAVPLVFVNRLGLQVALRTITVAIDASAGTELFQKLGSQGLMQFFRDIAQRILQCRGRLRGSKCIATVRRPPDALHKTGIGRQCLAQGYFHDMIG